MGVARTESFDSALDDGVRRVDVRISDAEDDDVLAPLAGDSCFGVRTPCVGAVAIDPVHQVGKSHFRLLVT
jgi:hypothetical protein